MHSIASRLDRAKTIWIFLSISGALFIAAGFSTEWILKNAPLLIYLLVVLAFLDLGLFGYLIYILVTHLRHKGVKTATSPRVSQISRISLISLSMSLILDLIYASLTGSWNDYTIILAISIAFGLFAIPFHILFEEIKENGRDM